MRCPLRPSLPMMFLLALLWVLFVLPTPIVLAELTASELRGLSIYQSGKSPTSTEQITAYFGEQRIPLPGETLPCTGCHGHDGTGRPESGLFPYNITWKFLTKSYGHLHRNGLEHPPFNAESLKTYLRNGHYPGEIAGSDPNMPLYEISDRDLEDLIAYIQQLGKQHEIGVSETSIKIGTLLPGQGQGQGHLAVIGQEMNNILKAYFNQINHNGGVYGRKLELVTLFLPNDQKLSTPKIEAWLAEHEPFALLSTFLPNAETELDDVIRDQNIPLIGPFTLYPLVAFAQNRQAFYLYPGLLEQMQALLHFVSQKIPFDKPKIAILYSQQDRVDSVLAGIGQASLERNWGNPLEIALGSKSTEQLIKRLEKATIDLVVFLGDERQTAQFLLLAAEAKWSPYFLGSGILAGKTIIEAPELFSERIFLSYPTLPVDRQDWGLKELYQLQRDDKKPVAHIQASISAYSSAKVLVEALRLTGRKIDRTRLISELEQFNKFATGLTPPISYSGNRHIGVRGIHVVRFSSEDSPNEVLKDAIWVELP